MAQKDKCAHPNCTCPAAEGSKYCSTYCSDAKDTTEVFCECGHADCATEAHAAGGTLVA